MSRVLVCCPSPIELPRQAQKNPTLLGFLSQILSQYGILNSTLVLPNMLGFISQMVEATESLIDSTFGLIASGWDENVPISLFDSAR